MVSRADNLKGMVVDLRMLGSIARSRERRDTRLKMKLN